jgi:hypothetical protein
MKVDITISGQLDIDDGDIESLKKESVSTLGAVLQKSGKNVKARVAEVYQKETAKAGK